MVYRILCVYLPNSVVEPSISKKGDLVNYQFQLWPTWTVSTRASSEKTNPRRVVPWKHGLGYASPRTNITKIWTLSDGYSLEIHRCYKPLDIGKVVRTKLHHFSDASNCGYAQCSYLRLEDGQTRVCCSLVMGTARLTPMRTVAIPRLELAASSISVKVSNLLKCKRSLIISPKHSGRTVKLCWVISPMVPVDSMCTWLIACRKFVTIQLYRNSCIAVVIC